MRIAMIGQKGLPTTIGGVERHVEELSTRLVKFGFEVTVYARKWYTGKTGVTMLDGVEIRHTNSIKTKHLDAISHSLFATIHALRHADILHYHGVGPALLAWIPRIFTPDKKVFVTFHCIDRKHAKWGLIARLFLRLGEWSACKFAHKTIAVSPTIYQYVQDQYNCHAELITNGVPLYKKTTETKILNLWGLPENDYVLAVSRLIPHKGIHTLIEAWLTMQTKYPDVIGDKKLVIVGDGHYTDSYVQELKNSTKDEVGIIFTGTQTGKNLAALFSHTTLFVHPSLNEGMPISVLEAMSYSLPVLSSDILEHRDLIHDKEMMFKANSAEDLTEKLGLIMQKNETELKKIGEFNRSLIEKYFNWDSIVLQIAKCYTTDDQKIPQAKKLKIA